MFEVLISFLVALALLELGSNNKVRSLAAINRVRIIIVTLIIVAVIPYLVGQITPLSRDNTILVALFGFSCIYKLYQQLTTNN